MKVVSWNIHRCFGVDRRYDPARVAQVLQEIDADVIALQEIDSSLRAEDGSNQLIYLARHLGMHAVMGPTLDRDYGAYGNAVLTKYEITRFDEHDLSYRRVEPRGAISIQLRAAWGEFRLVNTHLGLKYWERSFQIDRLLAQLVWPEGNLADPVIFLGDFNEWFPFSGNALRLERAFKFKSPRVPTFPAHWPRFALDRIYLSGPVADLSCEVPRTSLTRVASDHLPVIAQFRFLKERVSEDHV